MTSIFADKEAVESATIDADVLDILRLAYCTAVADGGSHWRRVASMPTHQGRIRSTDRYLPDGTTSSTNGGWWEITDPIITPEMFGARADGGPSGGYDSSQAFNDALSVGRDVSVGRKAGRYFLKNVIVNSELIDLGYALIQPAPEADCCFQVMGSGRVYGGEFRDSNNNLLKSTTASAAAAVGDTSVTVADSSIFRVGGLVTLVSSEQDNLTAAYGGPKYRVHHTTITAIAGSVLTLGEAVRYPIASGGQVYTALGCFDVLDGDGFVIQGQKFTTISLFATVRGTKPSANENETNVSSRGRIAFIQGDSCKLGFAMIEGDVSQMDYAFIKVNSDYASQDFRCGFGIKCDASQFDKGPNGGHHFVRVDIVGGQDAFDMRAVQFGGFIDCFADTMAATGFRFTGNCSRFSIGGARSWSAFNEKGISIGPNCLDIDIETVYTDNRSSNAPWGSNIDIEVADGAQAIRINRNGWTGSNLMRADVGWQTAANVTFERLQTLFESGSASAPSLAFREEVGLGLYRPSSGKVGFAAGGAFSGGFTSQGFLAKSGSVGAPGIAANGDEDTGFYFPAANQIGGAVGGAEAFLFSANLARFSKPVRPPSYTVATLPDASLAGFGAIIAVTDTSPPTLAMSTGSGWRPLTLGSPL